LGVIGPCILRDAKFCTEHRAADLGDLS
jgi:hypothetical protein